MNSNGDLFGYQMLSERYGVESIGTPDPEVIDDYTSRLPEYIIKIWRDSGFTSHGDGYLRFVDPGEYRNIIQSFGFSSKEFIPFAINSFGTLYCWSGSYVYQLDPYLGDMFLSAKIPLDSFFAFGFIPKDSKDLKLHLSLVKKLGKLDASEIFGSNSGKSPKDSRRGVEKFDSLKKLSLLSKTLVK